MGRWARCKDRTKWFVCWWWGTMTNVDGRRAWAFLALLGASGVFTVFAAVAVWLVRKDDDYAFILGLAAHLQLLICLSGFTAMFVKRELTVDTRYGKILIKDQEDVERIVKQDIRSDDAGAADGAGVDRDVEERGDQQAG